MMMARGLVLAAIALTSGVSSAGPRVDKASLALVSVEARAAMEPQEKKVAELTRALSRAKTEQSTAKGNIKTSKNRVKANKARVKADKASLKAARKEGDDVAKQEAKAKLVETRSAGDTLSLAARLAKVDAKIAKAQVAYLKASRELESAKLEVALAAAALEGGAVLEVPPFEANVASAEIDFERARQSLELLRAQRAAAGS